MYLINGVLELNLTIIIFTINGLLGGLVNALLHAKSWEEVLTYTSVRAVILGAIAGYMYYFFFSEWGFPNTVMAFIFGYSFKDMFESLYVKYREKYLEKQK